MCTKLHNKAQLDWVVTPSLRPSGRAVVGGCCEQTARSLILEPTYSGSQRHCESWSLSSERQDLKDISSQHRSPNHKASQVDSYLAE